MKLLILGDSVTAGYGLGPQASALSYPQLLRARFEAARLPVEVVTSALDGICSRYALRRYHRMVSAHAPDWVLVMLGLNDACPASGGMVCTPESYARNMAALTERLVARGARTVLVAPNPRFSVDDPTGDPAEMMRPYVAALGRVAGTFGVRFVNVFQQFLLAADIRQLVPDGIHPSPAGHELIAELLTQELLAELREPASSSPVSK